ncbi:HTTM domain-containing protein [Salipiger sp. 1_MG-2023]|uniref:HTTM domain-containing protein n=1 Tax=Salipiger sp. 1_MG-2023 TaxID=3062665 RepID=UPI0026E3BC20|nr:HTTM domain-containing protein [Salipiger sp. 1_MG-2023]MDO6585255.1 HTTM domain-containing protein [Salipiger sp. 1_MG-2023]
MGFEFALRLTEVMLALALAQQSLEQIAIDRRDAPWLGLRLALCAALLVPALAAPAIWGLFGLGLWWLWRYDGPFNGGSDKMTLLILACLSAAHLAPDRFWAEMALAYLAVQLVLSYVISGQVKLMNPAWRSGEALRDVFLFSAYPVSEGLRGLADRRLVTFWGGWLVMLTENAFPLFLLHPLALLAGLVLAAGFHLSNALLFGLNRFFWIWLCAWPSLIWLQGRLTG